MSNRMHSLTKTVTFHKHWLHIRPSTMTPSISLIVTVRDELEISIAQFQSYKSAVEKLLNSSTVTVKKETLIALRKKFELSLKGLNKCHTIWRCVHEEIGSESLIADYSTSWLESVWYEHSDWTMNWMSVYIHIPSVPLLSVSKPTWMSICHGSR